MKKLTALLILLIIIGCSGEENKTLNDDEPGKREFETNWIPIKWLGGAYGGKRYDRLSMEIPILINDSIKHYAQFDLGANTDMLYESTLKEYCAINSAFDVDTVGTEDYYYWLKEPNIKIGKSPTAVKNWIVRNDYDADGVIGTIGAEEIKDRILVIDYPNDRLAILDSISDYRRKKYDYFKFELVNNKVITQVQIGSKNYSVNFDTGSSITPLFVCDYAFYQDITNHKLGVDTLKQFTSWGKTIESIPGALTKDKLIIGDKDYGHQMVYYLDSDYHRNLFQQDRISALMGSIVFFENEILIDFKNKEFGIKIANKT